MSAATIAIREVINELRARQRNLSIKEEQHALAIQKFIRQQSEIEDKVIEWEVYLHKLKSEESKREALK